MALALRVVDEFDGGLGWICDETIARTSHALRDDDGGVWLVDPVAPSDSLLQAGGSSNSLLQGDGAASNSLLQAIDRLGTVRGVIQLLDRHNRDCKELTARYGVPHVRAYESNSLLQAPGASNSLLQAPFQTLRIAAWRWWREVALWWPERRVLVCGDALGTVGYFRAPGEAIGVHPLLRLKPPVGLRATDPSRILVGHGAGVHAGAAAALDEALRTARRRLPAAFVNAVRARRRGRRAPDM